MTIPDEPNEPPAPYLGIPDELIKLFEGAWLDAVARYDHHYMHHALAAVLSRHEQMVRQKIAEEIEHEASGTDRSTEYGLGLGNGLDQVVARIRGDSDE